MRYSSQQGPFVFAECVLHCPTQLSNKTSASRKPLDRVTTGSRPGFRPEVLSSSLPRKGSRTLAGEAFVLCGDPEPKETDISHLAFVRSQQRSQLDKGVPRSHTDVGVKVFFRAAVPLSLPGRS